VVFGAYDSYPSKRDFSFFSILMVEPKKTIGGIELRPLVMRVWFGRRFATYCDRLLQKSGTDSYESSLRCVCPIGAAGLLAVPGSASWRRRTHRAVGT